MIEGHLKIAAAGADWFFVLFFPRQQGSGGPVKAHWIQGAVALRDFAAKLGCPLSRQQLCEAQEGRRISATAQTKHACMHATDFDRYFR